MFDANAAYIPIGQQFFAEIHQSDSQLDAAGIKDGDIVLCEHVIKSEESARENVLSKIWPVLNGEPIEWKHNFSLDDCSWMVYSGRPNGNGFICEKWKAKALAFLGGQWHVA